MSHPVVHSAPVVAFLVVHHPPLKFAARHAIRHLIVHAVRFVSYMAGLTLPRKKVSVVTPTWQRARLLLSRCVPSVRAQTCSPAEHIIVSDGPDPDLAGIPGVVFLPGHEAAPNRGLWARRHGTELATGELIAYLDDDNAWREDHLAVLAEALDCTGADFAYSQAHCIEPGGYTWTIGREPPQFGQIDTSLIMHRRELLDVATWEPSPGTPADWNLVNRWVELGATWVFVPKVTLDYYPASVAV